MRTLVQLDRARGYTGGEQLCHKTTINNGRKKTGGTTTKSAEQNCIVAVPVCRRSQLKVIDVISEGHNLREAYVLANFIKVRQETIPSRNVVMAVIFPRRAHGRTRRAYTT